ncbi:hypothetical protein [Calothrix sp. NIES-2100]
MWKFIVRKNVITVTHTPIIVEAVGKMWDDNAFFGCFGGKFDFSTKY